MSVNYDRALEEEKIMNQVYPSLELQHNNSTSNHVKGDNKQMILNTEIFETFDGWVGKVDRDRERKAKQEQIRKRKEEKENAKARREAERR